MSLSQGTQYQITSLNPGSLLQAMLSRNRNILDIKKNIKDKFIVKLTLFHYVLIKKIFRLALSLAHQIKVRNNFETDRKQVRIFVYSLCKMVLLSRTILERKENSFSKKEKEVRGA